MARELWKKYLVDLYFRETYKNLADGMPLMTAAEKKEQNKKDRKHQLGLDNIAEKARREVATGTYMRSIGMLRIK